MGPAIGIGILVTIVVALYIANDVAKEMLEKQEREKRKKDCSNCAA